MTCTPLLAKFDALPVVIGGGSSGARLAMLFALKYPKDVRALLIWRVTGGPFAASASPSSITVNISGPRSKVAMTLSAASEHFAERIAQNPANRKSC